MAVNIMPVKSKGKTIMLKGETLKIFGINDTDKLEMFELMNLYYDNISEAVFQEDLAEKDWCVILRDENGHIKGFTTQKLIEFSIDGRLIHGIFSGDTIVHKEFWGELELSRLTIRLFMEQSKSFEDFYWFLISKGYKTYRFLPIYFKEFYPCFDKQTPQYEKAIMDTFASVKFEKSYNSRSGIIKFLSLKDKLKNGVADINDGNVLNNKHVKFFNDINPGHIDGDELMCIAKLSIDNLNRVGLKLLSPGSSYV